jgi:hypothetical protein
MVDAKCQATAKADASFHAECTPPKIAISYNLSASVSGSVDAGVDGGGLSATAELDAKIQAFGKVYAKLLAEGARIKGILNATVDLPSAGFDAVTGAVNQITAHGDIQAKFQAACALTELGTVKATITGAVTDLNASAAGIAKVSGSL